MQVFYSQKCFQQVLDSLSFPLQCYRKWNMGGMLHSLNTNDIFVKARLPSPRLATPMTTERWESLKAPCIHIKRGRSRCFGVSIMVVVVDMMHGHCMC
jgi:hypothetical protein